MKENWKDVIGLEGYYQVSDQGNVRSLDRYVVGGSRWGIKKDFIKGQNLSTRLAGEYLQVKFNKNKKITKSVHRTVAEAFIPNPLNLPEVNHINGNRIDNRACNLEWTTRAGNVQHAYSNNLVASGAAHHYAKIDESVVAEILYVNETTELTYTLIGSLFGICSESASNMCRGKSWKQPHIREKINEHLESLRNGKVCLSVDLSSIKASPKNFRRRNEKRYQK